MIAGSGSDTPSFLTRVAMLATMRITLKTMGFGRTIALLRRLTAARPRLDYAPPEELEQLAMAVARAAAVMPGRVRCLEQSATLFLLARRRGVKVQLRVGVQPYGFVAHAWVEYRGRPLFEPGETVRNVVALPDLIS